MNKVEILSGTIENVVSRSGQCKYTVKADHLEETFSLVAKSPQNCSKSNRFNALGQWRQEGPRNQRTDYFYAAHLFAVPHLVDADTAWIDSDQLDDLQIQRVQDANCLLQHLGVEKDKARTIAQHYKSELLRNLISTPFSILEEQGEVSFEEADRFARSLGLAPTTADRAAAGLRNLLSQIPAEGISLDQLKTAAIKQFSIFWVYGAEYLDQLMQAGAISVSQDDIPVVKVVDLSKGKKKPSAVKVVSNNPVIDLLSLHEGDSFVWEEAVRTVAKFLDTDLDLSEKLVLVIDTALGQIPGELPVKIENLAQQVGSSALYCSAIKPEKANKLTALDRYLVGIDEADPELVLVSDAHFLNRQKLKMLAQRLKKNNGLILFGDASYRGENQENPVNQLISSRKVPSFRVQTQALH